MTSRLAAQVTCYVRLELYQKPASLLAGIHLVFPAGSINEKIDNPIISPTRIDWIKKQHESPFFH
jgi:hypothetical protein